MRTAYEEKRELINEVCTKYLSLMVKMQEIDAEISILREHMKDLDFDVTSLVQNAKLTEG